MIKTKSLRNIYILNPQHINPEYQKKMIYRKTLSIFAQISIFVAK
jgi:hypothetical protein